MRAFLKHDHAAADCPGCNDRVQDAEQYLRDWFKFQKGKFPSMHVSWAHRDEASQGQAFSDGDSKLQWPNSKHNLLPSQALDVFQINEQKQAVFDPIFCAKLNDDSKKSGYTLRWGGEFKTLGDSGHFEMESK